MAETPTIKIQKEFEKPTNVESEVPRTQTMREFNDQNNGQDSTENTSTTELKVTGAEFTLSPVITVTKKESTLTKGDLKLQKVTVTEDIAMEDTKNGGSSVSRDVTSFTETSQHTSEIVSTSERTEKSTSYKMEREERSSEEKKSKIPMSRLRQAVEKVKRERQAQKAREQPRRSSIPKLKDAKRVKRNSSLQPEPKIEDEFDKIYNQLADNTPKDLDDKILAIDVEDSEKIESKFEEIVHSYDEEEYDKHTVSKVSKIPALRRRNDNRTSRLRALVDRATEEKKNKTATEVNVSKDSKLKDGGFKVTSSTIRTKRFSRGSSRDISVEEQFSTESIDIQETGDTEVFVKDPAKKILMRPSRMNKDAVGTTDNAGEERVSIDKENIVKDGETHKSKRITRVFMRDRGQNVDIDKKINEIRNKHSKDLEGTVKVEEFHDADNHVVKSIRENVKASPSQTIVRDVSTEIKKDDQNIRKTERVTVEDLEGGGSRTVATRTIITESVNIGTPTITELTVHESNNNEIMNTEQTSKEGFKTVTTQTSIQDKGVKIESFTRGISRELGNIKQKNFRESLTINGSKTNNVTVNMSTTTTENQSSQEVTESKKENDNEHIVKNTEDTPHHNSLSQSNDNKKKDAVKKETMKVEQIEKGGTRTSIPVYSKVTQSFSKGKIQNVAMSRTIEWKPADEVQTKKYSRSFSERVTKKELGDTGNSQFEMPKEITEKGEVLSSKSDITITSEDSVLETKGKGTTQDSTNKITVKNNTEYQSEKQVTNVEKTTYSLSKTIDLNVDRDYKTSREIGTQMSLENTAGINKESMSTSNEKKELQYSVSSKLEKDREVSISTTEINNETIVTGSEKQETKNSQSPTIEKDSDLEVTILKGNVSRLKEKIVNENVVVSKKETDEELPKEKTVLSKIAIFERLEPKEPYPVIKIPTLKKCKYASKTEEKSKTEDVQKEQTQLDSFGYINKVEIGSNYNEVTYVNEPVIVEAHWKSEEGYGNISTINRVLAEKNVMLQKEDSRVSVSVNQDIENARILPGTIEFTTDESNVGTAKTLQNVEVEDSQIDGVRLLPARIKSTTEITAEGVSQKEEDRIEESINITDKKDYEAEIGKSKPGKIDLNIWKHRVEINKSSVDKIEVVRSENLDEIAKTLPRKIDLKAYESHVQVDKELLGNVDLKQEESEATPLPATIDFGIDKVQFEVVSNQNENNVITNNNDSEVQDYHAAAGVKLLPVIIDFKLEEKESKIAEPLPDSHLESGNRNQNESSNNVAVQLPDIKDDKTKTSSEMNTRPGKLNLDLWKSKVEVNKTIVGKTNIKKSKEIEITKSISSRLEYKNYDKQSKVTEATQEKYNFNRTENKVQTAKTLPGRIDISASRSQVTGAQILPEEIEFSATENMVDNVTLLPGRIEQDETAKTLPDKIDFNTTEITVDNARTLPSTIDFSNNQTETATTLPGNIEFNKLEGIRTLPATIDFNPSENQNINAAVLPGDIDNEINIENVRLLPGVVDFSTTDRKDKADTASPTNNKLEGIRTLPATIDFNTTKNQIENVRTLPARIDLDTSKVETAKILPGKIDFNTADNKVDNARIPPGTIAFDRPETAATLPGKIGFGASNTPEGVRFLPATINFSNENEDVGTTNSPGNDNETQESGFRMLPGKIEFDSSTKVTENTNSNYNQTDSVRILPGTINSDEEVRKNDDGKPLPGKLDLRAWENQVEANKTLVDKIEVVRNENLEEIAKTLHGKSLLDTAKTLPAKIDLSTELNKVQIPNASEMKSENPVGRIDMNPFINKGRSNYFQIGFRTQESKLSNVTVQNNIELKNEEDMVEIASDTKECLSDPELVDEIPEDHVKQKDSIIGNIKRKMYFITNKSSVQSSTNEVANSEDYERKVDELQTKTYFIDNLSQNTKIESKTYTENYYEQNTITVTKSQTENEYEFNNNGSTVQNTTDVTLTENISKEETNENEFNITTDKDRNAMTRSAYGADDFKTTSEDLKRAKSLAELDLGDAVNGKVREILGRLNSVDFGRRESVKTGINLKELPKKMTVLEKIALFEGKASSIKTETTSIKTTTKKHVTQVISEEEYIKKIEELKTAKTKFGQLEDMLYLPLADGSEMPVIALGTALVDSRLLPHLIGAAIDLGYRAIDTAYIYGNEKEIGQAIKAKIDDGTVKREDLFIMSKLWSTFHRPDLVEEACRSSLKNLGLDYFDLYMIHNPMSFKEGSDPIPKIASVVQYSQYDYMDAWFGMEGLVSKGLVKSIGLSNFNSQQIQRVLDKGRLKPVVNQVECHPYLSQQRLHAFCAERNITLSCFGVLGSKGTPAEFKNSSTAVIDDALVKVMASGLGVTPAQLLIRYQIECGHNVVVKSSSAAHLWDNLQALTFTLDQPQVDALHALNKNKRTFVFKGMGDTHRNYPFRAPF